MTQANWNPSQMWFQERAKKGKLDWNTLMRYTQWNITEAFVYFNTLINSQGLLLKQCHMPSHTVAQEITFCMKLTNRQISCNSVHDAASTWGENMVSYVTHVSFFLSSKRFWLLTATSHPVSFLIILSIFLSVFAEQVSFTL